MSIVKKITSLLLLAGALPFVAMTYLNYSSAKDIIIAQVIKHLKTTTEMKAQFLHDHFHDLIIDLSLLATNKKFVEKANEIINFHETNKINSTMSKIASREYFNMIKPYYDTYELYDLFIVCLEGDVIYSVRHEDDYLSNLYTGPYKDTELGKGFRKSLLISSFNISAFEFYAPSKKGAYFFTQPIFKDGKIVGVLGAQINGDKVFEQVKDYSGIGNTGEVVIASKEDDKAVFVSELRNHNISKFEYSVKLGADDGKPIQEAVQGFSGSGQYTDYNGKSVLAAWMYIPYLRIGMVVKQETSEAFKDINKLYWIVLGFGLISLIIFIYVTYIIRAIVKNLIQTKDQYEYAINGTEDGLWDWNLITNEIFFSSRWKGMLGYTNQEMPNDFSSWKDNVHPDDLQMAVEAIEACHKDPNKKYEIIHRLKHKDGHWVWILDRGQTIFDDDGKASRMIGFHTDISKLKELEIKLHDTQLQFENFMQQIPAMVTIQDKKSKVIYSNHKTAKFFNKQSIIGMNMKDLHFVDDLHKMEAIYEIADKLGFADEIIETVDYNGNKVVFRVIAFSFHLSQNNQHYGSICLDITQEYSKDQEIRRYQKIFERSPFSMMITNKEGDIEFANPAFYNITGYSAEEIIGQNPRILKSGYTTEKEYLNLYDTITHNHVWTGKFKNLKKSGEAYWVSSMISPILDKHKNITHYVGLEQEITEQVYLEEELEKQEELMIAQSRHAAMGEMISMIAHQWRQPITTIAMSVNNIIVDAELDELTNENAKKLSEDIIYQTEYLSKTIEDFRNFFKPIKERELISLVDVVQEALKIVGKSLENNGIELLVENDASTPNIKTFSREILQVLINLLKNSKEAFENKGIDDQKIKVKIFHDETNVYVEVCDNAGGISPEILNNIFDPYFTTKDEHNGTGLGLYMSKTIMQKHILGALDVENRDEGACFMLTVPKSHTANKQKMGGMNSVV